MHKSPTKSFKSQKPNQSPLHPSDQNHFERYIPSRLTPISHFQPDLKDFDTHSSISSLFVPSFSLTPSFNTQQLLRPYKVLDAPNLANNFYYSVLDWGFSNVICVGLSEYLYLFNKTTSKVTQLFNAREEYSAVKFDKTGSRLAAGVSNGEILVFDLETEKLIRSFQEHKSRVGCCIWNNHILTSGGLDGYLIHTDLRSPTCLSKIKAHSEEICGLSWSSDYLATGSNDNSVKIFQDFSNFPIKTLSGHLAAVKSIDWSPFERHILLTGGGNNDKKIRVWDTISGKCVKEVDTGSQICTLMFAKDSKELVTGHGYNRNEIVVWRYPEITEKINGSGHEDRVLYMSLSPDGEEIVTGGADFTLRFWKVFNNKKTVQQDVFWGGLR